MADVLSYADCWKDINQEFFGFSQVSVAKIEAEVKNTTIIDNLQIEQALDEIFDQGWAAIKETIPETVKRQAQSQLEEELVSSKAKMTPRVYQETVEAALDDELKQKLGFTKYNLFSV